MSAADPEYPLHKAVWAHDVEKVRQLITHEKHNVDEADLHGNTALHLAVMLGNRVLVDLLLSLGADPRRVNRSGWSVMKEASSASDYAIFAAVVLAQRRLTLEKWIARLGPVMERLEQMDDFELKLKWEFSSWIPFLSRLCPHDVYTIRKRGSTVRMDTTIVDFESYRWVRGNVSFWFMGKTSDSPGKLKIVDHEKETFTNLSISSADIDLRQLKDEIQSLMKSDTFRTDTRPAQTTFSQQYTWFGWGGERVENVEGFSCKVYDMKDLEYAIFVRPRNNPSGTSPAEESGASSSSDSDITFESYFDPSTVELYESGDNGLADNFEFVEEKSSLSTQDMAEMQKMEDEFNEGAPNTRTRVDHSESETTETDSHDDSSCSGFPNLVPIESMTFAQLERLFSDSHESKRTSIKRYPGKATKKNVRAKWWLSQDFPLKMDQLFPLLEILAPTSQHFGKLQAFLSSKFPAAGFPVKVEIPIVPAALKALVTFSGFQWREVSEDEVTIPMRYKEAFDTFSPFGGDPNGPESA